MSWNFLKPKKNAPTEKNVARECEKMKILEDGSKRLLKDGRKLEDACTETSKLARKLGTEVGALSSENGDNFASILVSTMDECGKLTDSKYHQVQKTLTEPMRRYSGAFPHLNAHIKGYEKSQQEYAKIQTKIDKLREKGDTGPNIVKMHNLKKELVPVKEEFDAKRNMLLEEFSAFYNYRLQYLQPIFEAIVRSECRHHHELHSLFEKTLAKVTGENPECDLEADVQDTLEQIRALSITKD